MHMNQEDYTEDELNAAYQDGQLAADGVPSERTYQLGSVLGNEFLRGYFDQRLKDTE
jgi:hypothetical protein